ncbi:hypothetical protein [Sporichthya sp.]|uniref:TolB family protein n=1 Tax=Sporichthya sp. TaxID=65475 RepID=UPI0017EE9074|nr:hypothetical protein [Sporichthya sp.]MBA3744560.1 PD40 domain-containing protein [Sporichthya sp.]
MAATGAVLLGPVGAFAADAAAGETVVFAGDRDGDYEIFSINPDGSGLQQLTRNADLDKAPVISPDGHRIAFARYVESAGASAIFVMNADGTGERRLTDYPGGDGFPAFSPDGTKIAFARGRPLGDDILVMDANGDNLVALTDDDASDREPSFSPDGTRIVFSSASRADDVGGNGDVYVMDAIDGGHLTNLSSSAGGDRNPSFSPDGAKIVFSSGRSGDDDVFTMNADGSNPVAVSPRPGTDHSPRFSPDGSRIVFEGWGQTNTGNRLYTMAADGSGQALVTSGPSDVTPFWGVGPQPGPAPLRSPAPTPIPRPNGGIAFEAVAPDSTLGPPAGVDQPAWGAYAAPVPTPTPAPGDAAATVTLTVLDQGQGDGGFAISTPAGATVDMGTPITGSSGGVNFLDYNVATIPNVTVTDTRPGLLAWSVVAQLSNFDPGLIFARWMGWTPAVVGTANMGAVAGPLVPSGYPGTDSGLHSGRVMATVPDGHGDDPGTTATLTAALNLRVPTSVPAGDYTAVMTLTVLS